LSEVKAIRRMRVEGKTDPEPDTPEWYELFIEKPIQPLVRLFRENGFMTIESCGHARHPYVQFDYTHPELPFELDDFMQEHGFHSYAVSATIDRKYKNSKKERIIYKNVKVTFAYLKTWAEMDGYQRKENDEL